MDDVSPMPIDFGPVLQRLDALEKRLDARLDRLETATPQPAPTQPPAAASAPAWMPPQSASVSPNLPPPQPPRPPAPKPRAPKVPPVGSPHSVTGTATLGQSAAPDRLATLERSVTWTAEQVLRWVGSALVTLAGVFFVSTAINRGWIPPEAQLLAATAGGLGFLAAAVRLNDRYRPWSLPLALVGATVLAACAVASSAWLNLIPAEGALAASLVAAAVSVGVALRLREEYIAIAAGLLALAAPVVGGLIEPAGTAAALAWLITALLAAASLGIAQRWMLLRVTVGWGAALLLTALAVLRGDELAVPVAVPLLALAVTALTLWFGPIVARHLGDRVSSECDVHPTDLDVYPTDLVDRLECRLMALVPGLIWFALPSILGFTTSSSSGVAGLVVAAGFALIADHMGVGRSKVLYVSQLLGCSSLSAVSLAVLFDGPALLVSLAVHAVGSAVTAWMLRDRVLAVTAALTGSVAAGGVGLGIARHLAEGSAPAGESIAHGFVLALIAAATGLLYHRKRDWFDDVFGLVWIAGGAWVGSVALPAPQGQGLLSLIWAAMAVAAVIAGIRLDARIVRGTGYATLAVVVLKLLTVDLAEVDVFWRVGLFLAVGLGFLRFAFVLPQLMERWVPESAPQ